MALIFAILITGITGCSASTAPAGSTTAKPATAASQSAGVPATTDEELKDVLLKMSDEYESLGKELKAAESGKVAAAALRAHAPAFKALKARDKDNKLSAITMSEDRLKQVLGEDGFKKFNASVGSFFEAMGATEKFKDDPDWQAANKEMDEAMK